VKAGLEAVGGSVIPQEALRSLFSPGKLRTRRISVADRTFGIQDQL